MESTGKLVSGSLSRPIRVGYPGATADAISPAFIGQLMFALGQSGRSSQRQAALSLAAVNVRFARMF